MLCKVGPGILFHLIRAANGIVHATRGREQRWPLILTQVTAAMSVDTTRGREQNRTLGKRGYKGSLVRRAWAPLLVASVVVLSVDP